MQNISKKRGLVHLTMLFALWSASGSIVSGMRTRHDYELSKREINQTVSQHAHQLTRCFVRKVSRPNKGKVIFEITTNGKGRVTRVKLKKYTLTGPANKPFLKCVVRKIKRWKFPVTGVFSRTFLQPFYFEGA